MLISSLCLSDSCCNFPGTERLVRIFLYFKLKIGNQIHTPIKQMCIWFPILFFKIDDQIIGYTYKISTVAKDKFSSTNVRSRKYGTSLSRNPNEAALKTMLAPQVSFLDTAVYKRQWWKVTRKPVSHNGTHPNYLSLLIMDSIMHIQQL